MLSTFPDTKINLSGDIAYFHYRIDFRDNDFESDLINRLMKGMEDEMRFEMDQAASKVVGPEFRIRTMTIGKGSVELFVVLTVVGGVLMGFSRYKNLIESFELLKSQIEGILRRRFPAPPENVESAWIPAQTLAEAGPVLSGNLYAPKTPGAWYTVVTTQMILLWYVVLSHGLLLLLLSWLFYKKVSP